MGGTYSVCSVSGAGSRPSSRVGQNVLGRLGIGDRGLCCRLGDGGDILGLLGIRSGLPPIVAGGGQEVFSRLGIGDRGLCCRLGDRGNILGLLGVRSRLPPIAAGGGQERIRSPRYRGPGSVLPVGGMGGTYSACSVSGVGSRPSSRVGGRTSFGRLGSRGPGSVLPVRRWEGYTRSPRRMAPAGLPVGRGRQWAGHTPFSSATAGRTGWGAGR